MQVHPKLKSEIFPGQKIEYEVGIYLMAVLEYVCADVLKLAGNYTDNCGRRQIEGNVSFVLQF